MNGQNTNKVYGSREDEIRTTLSKEEVIRLIETKYPAHYSSTSGLDAWDQLLVCESVAESTPVKDDYSNYRETTSINVGVNGNGNDGCKNEENFELTPSKFQIITQLKTLSYRASPIEIEKLLSLLFSNCGTKEGWWLYVAQHWHPKSINSVIGQMIKQHQSGRVTIKNPAAYFTKVIKLHKKRRMFRGDNDSSKQQSV